MEPGVIPNSTQPQLTPFMKKQPLSNRRGVALVLVIAFLALLTGMIVAFLSTVSTETQVSKRAAAGTRGRELIDTVNALVMGQIREATSQGQQVAWASQPGMIRTYGTASGGASQSPLRYYKLYSAQNLVWSQAGGTPFDPTADVPATWAENDALYTDLNRPVITLSGVKRYPIVQPPPTESTSSTPVGLTITTPAGSDATINTAPMPVRWVYVLRDGRITSPTQSTPSSGNGKGDTVTWEPGSPDAPTETNPIVGRVAFWTDDETSKININTAAGDHWAEDSTLEASTFWDVPRFFTNFDKQTLANFQPAQREYQRFPGHPATTYLSAAFPNLSRGDINQIASRIQTGGSLGGTTLANEPIPLDADRLYAYEDELIFDNERGSSVITPAELEQSRFLITANSRAPEVNLFNQPRIAIWPVNASNTPQYRTAFDRLIAFCSQVNGLPYFFARSKAYSPVADYDEQLRNQALYAYLQKATAEPVPGYGGSFLSKYGADRDQILTEIFDYIRSTNLFDDLLEPEPYAYPTKGNQFTSRRTSTTGVDPGHGQVAPITIGTTMGFGRMYTLSEIGLQFICTADGNEAADANPKSNVATNKTLGGTVLPVNRKRIEAMLLLESFSPMHGWTAIYPDMQIRIRGLEQFSVGGEALNFPADGTVRSLASTGSYYHGRAWGATASPRYWLLSRKVPARGIMPADSSLSNSNSYPFVSIPVTINSSTQTMAFKGGELTIDIYSGRNSSQQPENLVQTLKVKFPSGNFPIPNLVKTGTDAGPPSSNGTESAPATTPQNWWSFSANGAIPGFAGRVNNANKNPGSDGKPLAGSIIRRDEDVVRTVQVSHGDYRLSAASKEVSADVFTPHRYYNDSSKRMAHTFSEASNMRYMQGSDGTGKLVSAASYDSARLPDIPYNETRANALGDWDNGVSVTCDGPYINKPDEGNNLRTSGTGIPYYDTNWSQENPGPTFFSPNRLLPSAAMFGSLPTGLVAGTPWQTLLFRPDPTNTHPGLASPKDHLLLDLFWMPVVEPYAISEPFSTAGKINMNYQIMPFTYIDRSTGLRALLRSERVTAIPTTAGTAYKSGSGAPQSYRYPIDADETLKQFKERFDDKDLFRSASEICDLYLVPEGSQLSNMPAYWTSNALTGDNVREHPYATLYPRLTTKSNTYRVHYRVQALNQVTRSRGSSVEAWASWEEGKDRVIAENRGSSIIERYVDPADPNLPDFATAGGNLDPYYRFRILSTTKFGPK